MSSTPVVPPQMTSAIIPWSETDKRIGMAMAPAPAPAPGFIPENELASAAPGPGMVAAGPMAQGQPLAPRPVNARPTLDHTVPTGLEKPVVRGVKRANQQPDNDDNLTQAPADNKKRKANNDNNSSASKPAKKKATTAKETADALLDVRGIVLPGKDTGSVPVYETCGSIRRQIRAILKKPGMTQAAFCRALKEFGGVQPGPNPAQLARFMEKKGVMGGNTSKPFYPSYVLFEKMRIRDGKAKSKFRMEMEEIHGKQGVNIEWPEDGPITMSRDETAYTDRWGSLHIERKGGRL